MGIIKKILKQPILFTKHYIMTQVHFTVNFIGKKEFDLDLSVQLHVEKSPSAVYFKFNDYS